MPPRGELLDEPNAATDVSPVREAIPRETQVQVDVPAWTPMFATVSGPKFLALDQREQGIIKKLHINLGHPTSDTLARHLSETKALQHLVEGAADYVCPRCAERTSPQRTTPGNLKDPSEFNDKISLDGFEWTSKSGLKTYVLHSLDDAARFYLGHQTHRDSQSLVRSVQSLWFQWAGAPMGWSTRPSSPRPGWGIHQPRVEGLPTENGVQPVLSAARWQRGRIERHGGIIEEMLDRIDNDNPITTLEQFDEALRQCFHAKNTMSTVSGFSPEQAVLGRAAKLPTSIVSDEDLSSHLMLQSQDTASESSRNNSDFEQRHGQRLQEPTTVMLSGEH